MVRDKEVESQGGECRQPINETLLGRKALREVEEAKSRRR